MLSALRTLMDLAKRKEFGEATPYLNLLYGVAKRKAKTRGRTIRGFFKKLEAEMDASDSEQDPEQAGAEGSSRVGFGRLNPAKPPVARPLEAGKNRQSTGGSAAPTCGKAPAFPSARTQPKKRSEPESLDGCIV